MDYGLLEFLGPVFRPVMRPLFTLPGRSTVDNLASFIEMVLWECSLPVNNMKKVFTQREATVISTTFSVVSITFAIVIAGTVGMESRFLLFYSSVILSCLIAAVIMPRIWPLNTIPDEYAKDTNGSIHDEDLPEGKSALGYGLEEATKVGLNAPGFINFSNLALKRLLICGLLYFR